MYSLLLAATLALTPPGVNPILHQIGNNLELPNIKGKLIVGGRKVDHTPAPPVATELQSTPEDMLWAHRIRIESVKAERVGAMPIDVQRVLVIRKLVYAGYLKGDQTLGKLANLSQLTGAGIENTHLLKNNQARAILAMVSYAEGTYTADGYRVNFGRLTTKDFRQVHSGRVVHGSSAEGKYQFMNYTGPSTAAAVGVIDGTPLSQDIMALERIKNRLKQAGLSFDTISVTPFEKVVWALAPEWASFPCGPGGPFGIDQSCHSFKGRPQPAKKMEKLLEVYRAALVNKMPPLGFRYVAWDADISMALKNFQYAYQVEAHGHVDEATRLALFNGVMGSMTSQPPPTLRYMPVSVHRSEVINVGDVIGGYVISSGYGPRPAPCAGCSTYHPAWDIATPPGTPVFSPFDNLEVSSFVDKGGGGNVLVFNQDGITYKLLHMGVVFVGLHNKGDRIGLTGSSGVGTGPHLDVRSKQEGIWVLPSKEVVFFMLDPTRFLSPS